MRGRASGGLISWGASGRFTILGETPHSRGCGVVLQRIEQMNDSPQGVGIVRLDGAGFETSQGDAFLPVQQIPVDAIQAGEHGGCTPFSSDIRAAVHEASTQRARNLRLVTQHADPSGSSFSAWTTSAGGEA